jgi:drug/metabolite transporter (DMT)-like permease
LLFAVLFAFVGILWALLPRDAPIEPFLIALTGAAAFALLVAVGSVLRARLTRQGRGDTSTRLH